MSSSTATPPIEEEKEYDEVSYLHDLYYNLLEELKAKKEIFQLIIDDTDPESNAYSEARYQLDKVTTELDKLYSLMQTVCMIEAFNTIKKKASKSKPEASTINNQPM